ncbi:MAG: sugar ABC transporter substrate-binding protein [Actinobacteria bacterium]|nr:sugar ABC transporter substrate-binding protein [Actinomycetota bacterium]
MRAPTLTATITVLALIAGACGSGNGTEDADIPLTFLLAANAEEVNGYEEMVAGFEEQTGLEVRMTPFARKSDLLARLTTGMSGGEPGDVFLVNWRTYGQFAAAGALAPVEPYLEASQELDAEMFAETPFDAFRYDGETLSCMPQNTSSLVVYYHADLFEEKGLQPPREGWTWDDFVRTAEALTDGEHYGLGIDAELIKIAPWVWQNGGTFVDDPVTPTRLTLQDGATREALDWYLDLSLVHEVVPPDQEERSLDKLSRFLQGGLGMLLSSRVEVPTLRTIEDFDWDVGPLPAPTPDAEATTILHSDAYCISAGSDRKDDAWRLIEYAMGQRGQEILAESGRTVPSRTDVAESSAFLQPGSEPENSEVYLRNVERMRVSPTIGSWPKVEQVGDAIVEDLFYGRIPRDEGIERLHRETDPLFEQVPGG